MISPGVSSVLEKTLKVLLAASIWAALWLGTLAPAEIVQGAT